MDTIRSIPVRYSAAVFFIAVGLFLLTLFVEVRIIFEYPSFGDISNIFKAIVQIILSILGFISGGITIYEFITPDESTDQGPKDQITIEGDVGRDVNLYLTDPEFMRSESVGESPTDEYEDEDSRSTNDE